MESKKAAMVNLQLTHLPNPTTLGACQLSRLSNQLVAVSAPATDLGRVVPHREDLRGLPRSATYAMEAIQMFVNAPED